ncbi:penicillin-binding protein activator [Acerihabitans arboris]|uniref:Penicillin-binding protein activator LpoA n=1 Tax=Acerihabitans arboris TaxID=2691583 RepID=A0A845SKP2_9GAMM|nr:penicillin-binding protein activator [Acerihabitans arboris]NDL63566.1 penicillin-binding protein activator [Acerihabitans arboris]
MLYSYVMGFKTGRVLPVVLAALILAACSGQEPQTPAGGGQVKAGANADYYLQQMQQADNDSKTDFQLLAIRALINEGKTDRAQQLLGTLPQALTDVQQREQLLLSAELAVAQKRPQDAAAALQKLDPGQLTAEQQARFLQVRIAAGQGQQPSLDLLRAYIAQEPLLKDQAHQQNIDQTWQTLLAFSAQPQANLVINADENVLQGWLDLQHVYQDNKQDPALLKAGIRDWQTRYPQNPAAKTLPTQLNQVLNYQPSSAGQIALFLPMSGQAQVFSSAIQQGFNAARNGVNTAPVDPAPAGGTAAATPPAQPPAATPITAGQASGTQVKIYDTSSQPLPALLAQAQQDGATMIVGPLLKNEVEQLYASQSTMNILALNQPEHLQNRPNICYFSLSPEDEARDAANHIFQQHRQQPLLLVPRGSLGDRVVKAFADAWTKAGGGAVLEQRIGAVGELKQAINSGSGIQLSGQPVSSAAPSEPQSVTIAGLTIPAPPSDAAVSPSATGGGAVDAVYIIATPSELALIKPMIDMRTSSRARLGLFASSRSYQADAGPDYRLEMEGLEFSDIPLLAGANPGLLQQTSAQFKEDYSLVRLYAMGMDAWTLVNHFSEMRQIPGFQVAGDTGQLSATPDCVINRKLSWLKYQQGKLVQAL